ncbi:MAG: nucleotidyltransferase family protein [Thermoflexales bacterium]|nr:nucleotidyltransferase family protein [Thermoflexales bacterium]
MQALILAGGLGTRLRALVSDRPKPLAEVEGKPFLAYLLEQLRAAGFCELVLCVGYKAGQIQAYFGDGSAWGVHIDYAVETQRLGTAGAIKNAARFVDGPFLALNGDSYLELNFQDMVNYHRRRRAANPRLLGSLAAVSVDDASAYGTLELDEAKCIVRFREKEAGGSGWINGGVYVLEPEILDLIPPGQAVSIEKEIFPQALEQGYALLAYPVAGFFVDIGTPEGYRRFQNMVAQAGTLITQSVTEDTQRHTEDSKEVKSSL